MVFLRFLVGGCRLAAFSSSRSKSRFLAALVDLAGSEILAGLEIFGGFFNGLAGTVGLAFVFGVVGFEEEALVRSLKKSFADTFFFVTDFVDVFSFLGLADFFGLAGFLVLGTFASLVAWSMCNDISLIRPYAFQNPGNL